MEAGEVSDLDVFRRFVESVFYIGKGKNARSLQHLKDAKECLTQGRKKVCRLIQSQELAFHQNILFSLFLVQQSSKLRHILDVWSAGYGVISLHVFYNTTAEEAFTREACMIDAIGERELYPDSFSEPALGPALVVNNPFTWTISLALPLVLFPDYFSTPSASRKNLMEVSITVQLVPPLPLLPPSPSPGLDMLTNVVRGQPHGDVVQWSPSRKRHFGVYLLHKALRAYLIDPPQQIYQTDL